VSIGWDGTKGKLEGKEGRCKGGAGREDEASSGWGKGEGDNSGKGSKRDRRGESRAELMGENVAGEGGFAGEWGSGLLGGSVVVVGMRRERDGEVGISAKVIEGGEQGW
jgi:hypothetical protein